MKKFILKLKHNTLFGIVIGILISSGIVYGVNTYESNTIKYSPTDSSWEVSNVSEAINSLYNMKNELDTTKTNLNNLKGIGDATAAQILSGKKVVVKGSTVTGTMTNRGTVTKTLNSGESYTIPAGYHNGSGKVTVNSLASQTSATATAEDIVSGKTAYVNGTKITGTATINSGEANIIYYKMSGHGTSFSYNVGTGYSKVEYAITYGDLASSGYTLYARTTYNAETGVATVTGKNSTLEGYFICWK